MISAWVLDVIVWGATIAGLLLAGETITTELRRRRAAVRR